MKSKGQMMFEAYEAAMGPAGKMLVDWALLPTEAQDIFERMAELYDEALAKEEGK